MEHDLKEFSLSSACENPKLEGLQKKILSYYAVNKKAQGIVFCKTREMTFALMNWMKELPSLAVLNPHNITGSGNTEKHGLSACHIIMSFVVVNNTLTRTTTMIIIITGTQVFGFFVLFLFYSAPNRRAKYCDERVCLSLCICVCPSAITSSGLHVRSSAKFYTC